MIRAKMNFHAVGQGCFYTGRISGNRVPEQFNFVYDCGTVSNPRDLDTAITDFKSGLLDKTIDLCIISHFDQDHINGITKLLEGITCKRLVMPYYEPIERLALIMNAKKISRTYKNILRNPIGYFSGRKFNIWEIVLVDGSGGSHSLTEFPNAPFPDEEDAINREETIEGRKLKDTGFSDDWQDTSSNEERLKEISRNDPGFDGNSNIKLVQMPYRIRTDFWQFIFYCRKFGENRYSDRRRKIGELTAKVEQCFQRQKRKYPKLVKRISDLFRDDMIVELRKLYINVFGENLNVTTLMMYHQPLQSQKYIFQDRHFHTPYYFPLNSKPNATLLTGDIDIEKENKLKEMCDYFQYYLSQVIVFQVPHHGSRHNWPLKVNPSLLPVFPIYVINYGLGRVNHPSKEVVDDIRAVAAPNSIVLNNEASEYWYCYDFL